MFDLIGKKIMVTGASSGIGRATAILISKLGGKVVACGRDENRLSETLSKCEGTGHLQKIFDVRDTNNYKNIFDDIVSDGEKLDGLAYCSGIAPPTPLRVFDEKTLREVLDINFIGFAMMVSMYAKKNYNNGGSIVGISALNLYYPQECMTAYAASKAAMESSARTFAIELAKKKIRINCVAPGPTDTPMLENIIPESQDYFNLKMLLPESQPEDIANAVIFLLGETSRTITGRTIFVDSG